MLVPLGGGSAEQEGTMEQTPQYPKGPMYPEITVQEATYPMETMYRAIKAMEERGVDKRVIQEVYRRGWFTPEKYVTVTRA